MDTDAHGSKTKGLSVSIRVNPWLNWIFRILPVWSGLLPGAFQQNDRG
jgi:hypothetical protein